MTEINQLTTSLYAGIPEETLYHYTTFTSLLGIVDSGSIWASDIRYMNDSAELRHTADLIKKEAQLRIAQGHTYPEMLNHFVEWVSRRTVNGPMLFAASFRSHGNLLSQWRGYSSLGKGVSIGFAPQVILDHATKQNFQVGRCIYDPKVQRELICKILDAVEETHAGSIPDGVETPLPDPCYFYEDVFTRIELDLLRIAAVIKHPSFQEEQEWRVVSPIISDFDSSQVQFREGHSMLVPYVEFALCHPGKPLEVEHLYLGPTPNKVISMNSLHMFLEKNKISPRQGLDYCQIPFRKR